MAPETEWIGGEFYNPGIGCENVISRVKRDPSSWCSTSDASGEMICAHRWLLRS
jgi:hypothetical protein